MSKRSRSSGDVQRHKKTKAGVVLSAKLNSAYNDTEELKKLYNAADDAGNESLLIPGEKVRVVSSPFKCCVLPKFIEGEEFLEGLQEELMNLKFHEKNNDLYKFWQSDDLQNVTKPHIKLLRKILYEDFKAVLSEVTGITFNDTIDMTCSQYNFTDVLLCHDDELEGRRVAFILYLVPKWTSSDGGLLNLFSKDENGQPDRVAKSLCPARNAFVFFEVSPISFHEVSEILSKDKTRLSISGWFHGEPFTRPEPYIEPITDFKKPVFIEEETLRAWINPTYLEDEVQMSIQEKFQDDSEIQLQDFLNEDKFLEVSKALASSDIEWIVKGPANKRRYDVGDESTLPAVVKECLHLFQSEAMFLILSNLTGLTLHELAARSNEGENAKDKPSGSKDSDHDEGATSSMDPRCRLYARQWRHGSYTLIHDEDQELSEFALDASLSFCSQDWNMDFGGYTSYIAKGEDEELLTVQPAPNSLALVYRDKETLRFTKYVNSKVKQLPTQEQSFRDIFAIYYE